MRTHAHTHTHVFPPVKLLVSATLLGLILADRQRCQAMHSVSEVVPDKTLLLAQWIFSLSKLGVYKNYSPLYHIVSFIQLIRFDLMLV